jgi:hypothetical protein
MKYSCVSKGVKSATLEYLWFVHDQKLLKKCSQLLCQTLWRLERVILRSFWEDYWISLTSKPKWSIMCAKSATPKYFSFLEHFSGNILHSSSLMTNTFLSSHRIHTQISMFPS